MILRRQLKLSIIWRLSWRALLFFAIAAALAAALHRVVGLESVKIPLAAVAALGTALAIFLGFRNNSAYDRWWEARKLWGALVNASRSFARQVLTFVQPWDASAEGLGDEVVKLQRELIHRHIAYVHALRLHLRKQEPDDDLLRQLSTSDLAELATFANRPGAIALQQGQALQRARQLHLLDDFRHMSLDQTLCDLLNIQGGCERIKNTPIPRQYDYYPRVFVFVYGAFLPFALAHELGWFTALVSIPISYLFYVIDAVGRNNEAPFENRITDTPMTALCRTIEIDLRQMLGESDVPPALQPVDGFLF